MLWKSQLSKSLLRLSLQVLIKQPSILITIIIMQLREAILLHHLRQNKEKNYIYWIWNQHYTKLLLPVDMLVFVSIYVYQLFFLSTSS